MSCSTTSLTFGEIAAAIRKQQQADASRKYPEEADGNGSGDGGRWEYHRRKRSAPERFSPYRARAKEKRLKDKKKREKRQLTEMQDDASTPLKVFNHEWSTTVAAAGTGGGNGDGTTTGGGTTTAGSPTPTPPPKRKPPAAAAAVVAAAGNSRKKDVETQRWSPTDHGFCGAMCYHGNGFPVHEVYSNVADAQWEQRCFELPKFVEVGPDYATDNYYVRGATEDDEEDLRFQSFREKLDKALDRPYDEEELVQKMDEVLAVRDLRKKLFVDTVTECTGQSYLAYHRDFGTALSSTSDGEERLRLLRGFFCWVENHRMEDSFRPWLKKRKISTPVEIIELD